MVVCVQGIDGRWSEDEEFQRGVKLGRGGAEWREVEDDPIAAIYI